VLSIAGVSKTYPNGVRALRGVSLDVGEGLFGLLGPNGAGKSTLMRAIATLQEPDAGSISLDGIDVLARPMEMRRRLGYLPQEFGVYPGVSARALLEHLALLKGVSSRSERTGQVEALLRLTNLHAHAGSAVERFSGGMKRRFGIAQALLGDPRLVVVDEPSAGLDPEERNRLHDLLGQVAERRVVLLSTHIVEDVRQLCTRMAVLAAGRVVLEGEPEALVRALAGRLFRRTVTREEAALVREELPVLSTRLRSGRVEVRVLADARPAAGFEEAEPGLEEVYFASLRSSEAA